MIVAIGEKETKQQESSLNQIEFPTTSSRAFRGKIEGDDIYRYSKTVSVARLLCPPHVDNLYLDGKNASINVDVSAGYVEGIQGIQTNSKSAFFELVDNVQKSLKINKKEKTASFYVSSQHKNRDDLTVVNLIEKEQNLTITTEHLRLIGPTTEYKEVEYKDDYGELKTKVEIEKAFYLELDFAKLQNRLVSMGKFVGGDPAIWYELKNPTTSVLASMTNGAIYRGNLEINLKGLPLKGTIKGQETYGMQPRMSVGGMRSGWLSGDSSTISVFYPYKIPDNIETWCILKKILPSYSDNLSIGDIDLERFLAGYNKSTYTVPMIMFEIKDRNNKGKSSSGATKKRGDEEKSCDEMSDEEIIENCECEEIEDELLLVAAGCFPDEEDPLEVEVEKVIGPDAKGADTVTAEIEPI